MRVCPSCGFANSEDATKCALCGRALVPSEPPEHPEEPTPAVPPPLIEQAEPSTPVSPPPLHALPAPPSPNGPKPRNSYLRGLAFGSIPLLIFWIFGGIAGILQHNSQSPYNYPGATPFFAGIVLGAIGLVIVLLATIVCLARRQTRFLGYGLLTMLLVSPVAAVLGCQIYLGALSTLSS